MVSLQLSNNRVTFRDDLIQGSQKIEGTDVLSSLLLKIFDYQKGNFTYEGAPEVFRRDTDIYKVC